MNDFDLLDPMVAVVKAKAIFDESKRVSDLNRYLVLVEQGIFLIDEACAQQEVKDATS